MRPSGSASAGAPGAETLSARPRRARVAPRGRSAGRGGPRSALPRRRRPPRGQRLGSARGRGHPRRSWRRRRTRCPREASVTAGRERRTR
eukprot:1218343-Lingulodinium_polyedra.AAC.1